LCARVFIFEVPTFLLVDNGQANQGALYTIPLPGELPEYVSATVHAPGQGFPWGWTVEPDDV
jgi:hypothetical protein